MKNIEKLTLKEIEDYAKKQRELAIKLFGHHYKDLCEFDKKRTLLYGLLHNGNKWAKRTRTGDRISENMRMDMLASILIKNRAAPDEKEPQKIVTGVAMNAKQMHDMFVSMILRKS